MLRAWVPEGADSRLKVSGIHRGLLWLEVDEEADAVPGLYPNLFAAIAQGWLGWGLMPSLAAGIAVGIAIGAFQGGLTAYLNIPAFIVTLGGLLAWLWVRHRLPE